MFHVNAAWESQTVAALGLLVVVQAVVHEVALEVLQGVLVAVQAVVHEVALKVLQEVALEVVQEVVQDSRRISNHGNVNL